MDAGARTDVLLGAAAAALGVGGLAVLADEQLTVATGAGAVVVAAALAVSRTRPRAAGLVAAAGLLVTALDDVAGTVPYLVVLATVFVLGRGDRSWMGLAVLVAVVAASEAGVAATGSDAFVPFLFLGPTAWGAGLAVGEREEVAARLAERARELEEEREAYAQLSVRYERARIASELHDIVAHAISVMVVQAGAGQRLARLDPDLTAEAFAAIAESARQAEQDMARLVALLSEAEAIGPAPDIALVEELVARAAGSGLDVSLRLEGEREGLPAEAAEVAYRVVQESLTNALRYASGSAVRVLVRGSSEDVRVEVANDPAAAQAALAGTGTGNGLRGLRERVGAAGGTFDAGPTGDGGWHVSARLPRRAAVAA